MQTIAATDIMKVREASIRAKNNGMDISEYTLRRAIKAGQIPCRIVGLLGQGIVFLHFQQLEDGLDQQHAGENGHADDHDAGEHGRLHGCVLGDLDFAGLHPREHLKGDQNQADHQIGECFGLGFFHDYHFLK